jgi:23S rRNA pseudouridine1911/1915/1917 synthase
MPLLNRGFEFRKHLGADAAGLTLIDYLVKRYAGFTRQEWLDRVESGRVLLDGIPANPETVLRAGANLSWLRPPWVEPEVPRSFAILYQDEYLLGVAKPEGLPTMPGGGVFMENTLFSLIRNRFPSANPLHRLGRGTSGVVLFATTRDAASKISQAWRCGGVLKVYRALVSGFPERECFEVDTPIGSVPHRILKSIHAASPSGKPAHSRINVLERRDDCSLVRIRIATGRPHQIRIHLAAAGYPLVGDPLYTIGGIPGKDGQAVPGDLGYHLHSELLGFPHPATNNWTEIACAPPPVLRRSNETTG